MNNYILLHKNKDFSTYIHNQVIVDYVKKIIKDFGIFNLAKSKNNIHLSRDDKDYKLNIQLNLPIDNSNIYKSGILLQEEIIKFFHEFFSIKFLVSLSYI